MNWIGLATFIEREVRRMLRVLGQTVISPLISATLYIFIFGYVVGQKIDLINGVEYITFVFPGILMLNIMSSSFAHSSSSVFFGKFIKSIEELLVTPFSYVEIIIGFVSGAVIRALIVSFGILGIGVLFGAVTLTNLPAFIFYTISISIIFGLLGIIVALWAKSFEQLSSINIFVITPLSYLGGIFYSISMLPEQLRFLTVSNPFFYFIDGIRNSMIGVSEANTMIGLGIIVVLIVVLGGLTAHLIAIGWRIRV